MNRALLTLFLIVTFVATTFGWDLSLAPGLSVKNALLYLIIIIFMIETAVLRNRRFELPSVLVPFGLLVGYSILSWFTVAFVVQLKSYSMLDTAISLKTNRLDHFLLFLLFFYGLSATKDVVSLLRTFLWLFVIGNLVTVIDAFNIPDLGIIQQREDGRIGGPMGESNQYGALLALTLPATIALMWDPQTKRIFALFASFISILAFLLAGSRGAFVGVIVGSLFSVYYLRSYISMRYVVIGALAFTAAIAVTITLFLSSDLAGDLIARFTDTLSGSAWEVSSGRNEIWTSALQQMSEQPFSFFSGFGWEVYKYINKVGFGMHNVYLDYLFNLGLVGLTLYCVLLYNLLSSCRNVISKTTGIKHALLIAFVFGFVSMNVTLFFVELYKPWIWIWAYTGLLMRLVVASSRPNEDEMKAC